MEYRSLRRRTKKKSAILRYTLLFIIVSFLSTFIFSFFNGSTSTGNSSLISKIRRDLLTERATNNDPLNVLIIGSDARNGESARSDTLILMHVHFSNQKVYFISIPRDTRVYIPNQGIGKINAAFSYGGAALAIKTVEEFLSVNLNHYAVVDFQGFKQMVDTLGGITVDVKEPINDRSYSYRMHIPKGKIKMNGSMALNYVRYRHGDSDFKRAERQQNFIKSLAKEVLTVKALTKLPALVNILNKNIETDMSKREMLSLGGFLRTVKDKQIETITVPGVPKTINGQSYVIPNINKLELIIARMEEGKSFKDLKIATNSSQGRAKELQAYITVLNGTGTPGLASKAKVKLTEDGLRVVNVSNARSFNYQRTEIHYNPSMNKKANEVRQLFFAGAKLVPDSHLGRQNLTIILGRDYYQFNQWSQ